MLPNAGRPERNGGALSREENDHQGDGVDTDQNAGQHQEHRHAERVGPAGPAFL
jgi:hypothetical protein